MWIRFLSTWFKLSSRWLSSCTWSEIFFLNIEPILLKIKYIIRLIQGFTIFRRSSEHPCWITRNSLCTNIVHNSSEIFFESYSLNFSEVHAWWNIRLSEVSEFFEGSENSWYKYICIRCAIGLTCTHHSALGIYC